jgi:hypothetical protein
MDYPEFHDALEDAITKADRKAGPRLLTKLKIASVASVDRGAGEDVKVLLMKRDGAEPDDADSALLKSLETIAPASNLHSFADRVALASETLDQYQRYCTKHFGTSPQYPSTVALQKLDELSTEWSDAVGINKSDARTAIIGTPEGHLLNAVYLDRVVQKDHIGEFIKKSTEGLSMTTFNELMKLAKADSDRGKRGAGPALTVEQAFAKRFELLEPAERGVVKGQHVYIWTEGEGSLDGDDDETEERHRRQRATTGGAVNSPAQLKDRRQSRTDEGRSEGMAGHLRFRSKQIRLRLADLAAKFKNAC